MIHKFFHLTVLYTFFFLVACSPAEAPKPGTQVVEAVAPMTSNLTLAKDHFHPKGKAPSEHTKRILREARSDLPLSDKRDFEEYAKGFMLRRTRKLSRPMPAMSPGIWSVSTFCWSRTNSTASIRHWYGSRSST